VIGQTNGVDRGTPGQEIITFINKGFAQRAEGKLWSQMFPPSHHTATIAYLTAAAAGDPAALAWLQGPFFTVAAAPARFASLEPFTVAEWSSFNVAETSFSCSELAACAAMIMITNSGCSGPVTTSSTLPLNLALSGSVASDSFTGTALISGVPAAGTAGTYIITITAGNCRTADISLVINSITGTE
jgi:hypothetical protein